MDEPKNRDELGRFPAGSGGRPRGVQNKITREVKEAFRAVFEALQEDETQLYSLKEWAKANPGQFYQLASKLIPAVNQTKHEHSGSIEHRSVSETDAWIERVTGRGANSSLPESLSN